MSQRKKTSRDVDNIGESQNAVKIYQFRVCLTNISPLIWRRILVRSDNSLADLHFIIQILMNWGNAFLHRFTIYGKYYAVPRSHGADADNAREVRLQDLKLRLNQRFLYEYSFFDWWTHELRLERVLEVDEKQTYPVCVAGSRVSPLEDLAGAEGFMKQQQRFIDGEMTIRILEICVALQQQTDEETKEMYREEIDHFGYWLNVEPFDRQGVNARLKWYAQNDERWTEGLESV